ncbi:polysaccharide biosynthesis tyrosine autokinase [Pseudonocardia sp. KRD-184]|uniref:non-specific protein-tyrosine kinase n=1 Tax=Pseudonocardia oceani TaxID=2792013 RepID=A0ABS6U5J3_9PSEU|nr:polysaccharide biosynthesis tyrosine autokinase [Pseudonocardia oceani]MBW0091340.1 polysaccharide biosynthesis tyrosine autokinase [Pseudonocardia oceani]MBW0098419.1 polysaccharide biosynthesis tyrosine autokinase [Pseudonocardia oceani]MBW0125000.1 polysaccharide biosynthesis tyrosine autokinase [Pseudonocardia oceani]MBW0127493.1 polysaccharide biosynthesis tyrosine autokinase [Pseudonocardia oceani]
MRATDILRTLRERWLIVVISVLVATAAAAAASLIRPADYTAGISMYVFSQGSDSASAAYQAAQLSEQRVTSYVELVGSRRVSEDVIARLGLNIEPEELASRITASSSVNSVLIKVEVEDHSPQLAAELANTVGAVFADLVEEVERPTTPGTAALIAVRVVQEAAVPTSPSSPGLSAAITLGLLAGLAVGVGSAFARDALDNSIRSIEQLRTTTDAPNLGVLAYDSRVPKMPLTVHDDPQSARAEAFRQLRNNLQFIDLDNPCKIIVVTSAMPAEGKTTTLVNLAIALSSANSRVLVIEGDLRRPKLSDLLALDRTSGLSTVLVGRTSLDQVIQPWGGAFDLLASGPLPPNPSELLASRQMRLLLESLRGKYDVVLIDAPPLLPVADAAAVAPVTDGAILICRHGSTTTTQLARAAESLRSVNSRVLGTVLTMAPRNGPYSYGRYNSLYRTETRSRDERIGDGPMSVRPAMRPTWTEPRELGPGRAAGPASSDRFADRTGRMQRVERDGPNRG